MSQHMLQAQLQQRQLQQQQLQLQLQLQQRQRLQKFNGVPNNIFQSENALDATAKAHRTFKDAGASSQR